MQLLALHDADNAPSEWGPGAGARPVTIGEGSYTAFFTHVAHVVGQDRGNRRPRQRTRARPARRLPAHPDRQRVVFRALYEQGLKEQLEDIEHFRSFEYGIYDPHKKSALAGNTGMVRGLLQLWQKVPSVRVKMGMSRRSRRDAHLPQEVADDVIAMSDIAEQFFDWMIISGPSKTRK